MYRRMIFPLSFLCLLLSYSFAWASDPLSMPEVLKSRKVIGVIYFSTDSVNLSKKHRAEIDRIASQVVAQFSPEKIVRIEGFTSNRGPQGNAVDVSLLRAKSVWHYFEKMNSFNSGNLYLTGFNDQQSLSRLQGERVEIVIYEDPFKETKGIYSSN